jgi:acetyl-CoA acetyltransferase
MSSVAIVGAAETTELGVIPNMSQLQLHADAALNALADAGLTAADIDGVATAGESPTAIAHYLGITPEWVDGTQVGGCSFMIHVRHAVAAIQQGLCKTVLITHGESGRRASVPAIFAAVAAALRSQGSSSRRTAWSVPDDVHIAGAEVHERLRHDARTTCDGRGRAARVGVEESAREFSGTDHGRRRAEVADDCVSVPSAGVLSRHRRAGALILVSGERAADFPRKPVYVIGTGESVETPMVSQMEDLTSSRAFGLQGNVR